jgi:hypothetical protein
MKITVVQINDGQVTLELDKPLDDRPYYKKVWVFNRHIGYIKRFARLE